MNNCILCGKWVPESHKHAPEDYENAAEYTAPKWTVAPATLNSWGNSTATTAVNTHWSAPVPALEYIEEQVTYETAPDGSLIKKTTSRGVPRGEPYPVPDGSPWPPVPEDPYDHVSVHHAVASETALEEIMHVALGEENLDLDLEEYKEIVKKHMRAALGALVRNTVHQVELDAQREANLAKHAADVALMNAVNQMIDRFRNKAREMLEETDETIELAPGVYKHAAQKILDLTTMYDLPGKSL